jgi:hypothetical protein
MNCHHLRFSRHALERMFERAISPGDVARIVAAGEAIAEYPDDRPNPSRLLLGYLENRPIHVVVAYDSPEGECVVITVYQPDPALWDQNFKSRRSV